MNQPLTEHTPETGRMHFLTDAALGAFMMLLIALHTFYPGLSFFTTFSQFLRNRLIVIAVATVIIFLSSQLFHRIPFIGDSLILCGRHALYLFIVHLLDFTLYKHWAFGVYQIMDALVRVVVVVSVTEIIVQTMRLFKPLPRTAESTRYFQTYRRFFDFCFFALFTYSYFNRFFATTFFIYEIDSSLFGASYVLLSSLGMICLASTLAFEDNRRRAVAAVLVFLCGIVCWYFSSNADLFPLCLLIACMAGRDFKPIARICVLMGSFIMGISYVAMRLGIIGETNYAARSSDLLNPGAPRRSLGLIYSTDWGTHAVFLLILLCLLVGYETSTITSHLRFLLILFVMVLDYFFVKSMTAMLLLILLLVGTLWFRLRKRWIPEHPPRFLRVVHRIAAFCSVYSFLLFAAVMLFLNYFYDNENPLPVFSAIKKLPFMGTFFSRFRMGHSAMMQYPLQLFPRQIYEMGSGGKPDYSQGGYFFIDCSYVRLWVIYGLIFMVLILGLMTYIQIQNHRRKDYYAIFLLFIVAIDCISEHHIAELTYNVFLLMAFSDGMMNGSNI